MAFVLTTAMKTYQANTGHSHWAPGVEIHVGQSVGQLLQMVRFQIAVVVQNDVVCGRNSTLNHQEERYEGYYQSI